MSDDEDDEEYHIIMAGDDYTVRIYRNGRCFNVHREDSRLPLTPRPMFAGVSRNDLDSRWF